MFDNVVDAADGRSARALRGRRPLRAGRPLAAVAAHRADVRAREPQARLLPLHGVPDRALARQQRHEPPARSRSRSGSPTTRASTGSRCSSRSPTPAWATAGSAASRRASSTRWRRCSCPAMGYGLRYEYGIFRQTIEDGWQREQPDNWLRRPDPWEVARPQEQVEVKLGCSFEVRGGSLGVVAGRPSSLLGLPFDRPVVGYGGKTINTLRLWAAAAPDVFDFQAFSAGEFVSALAERLTAESLTRVLYPDDSTSMGQGLRFVQEYFLVACSLADLVRRFRRSNADWSALPDKVAIQLNDTHPSLAVPELMRILLDEAQPRLGPGLGPHPADARLHQPHAAARGPGEMAAPVVRGAAAASSGDHPRDQPPAPRGGADPLPGRRGPRRAREPRRGGRRAQDPDGQSRHRRLAQHQRRRRHPFRPAAHGDGQGPGRDVPRALQQQDQRRDAAALAAAGQPGAGPLHHRGDRRRLDHGPRRARRSSSRSPTTGAFATPSATPSARPSRGLRTGSDRPPA